MNFIQKLCLFSILTNIIFVLRSLVQIFRYKNLCYYLHYYLLLHQVIILSVFFKSSHYCIIMPVRLIYCIVLYCIVLYCIFDAIKEVFL